jgi:hypothetical protein
MRQVSLTAPNSGGVDMGRYLLRIGVVKNGLEGNSGQNKVVLKSKEGRVQ